MLFYCHIYPQLQRSAVEHAINKATINKSVINENTLYFMRFCLIFYKVTTFIFNFATE